MMVIFQGLIVNLKNFNLLVLYPTELTRIVKGSCTGALILNCPLASVVVWIAVPLIRIVAPITVVPSESFDGTSDGFLREGCSAE